MEQATQVFAAISFLVIGLSHLVQLAFHNVWRGPALVLTLIGWAQVLKGAGVAALLLSGFLWWLRFGR